MIRKWRLPLLVPALLVALIQCQVPISTRPSPTPASGRSLAVSWNGVAARARTILPSSYPDPATYTVVLDAPGEHLSQTGLTGTSWRFDHLSAAVYSVTVDGLDGSGSVIVTGTGSADLRTDAAQTVSIVLKYIATGTGTGGIGLTFTVPEGITVSSTSLTLVTPSGTFLVNDLPLGGGPQTFTYDNASVPVGSYMMFAKFDTGSKSALRLDTVIVLQNLQTISTIPLAPNDFTDNYAPVTGLSLEPGAVTLALGGGQALTAVLAPPEASNTLVTWSTGDPLIATVVDGVVTANGCGTTTITATSVDNPLATSACTVRVALSLSISTSGPGTITTPASSPIMVDPNVPTTIEAAPDEGCTFLGWTVVSGSGVAFESTENAASSVTLSTENAEIRAEFSE